MKSDLVEKMIFRLMVAFYMMQLLITVGLVVRDVQTAKYIYMGAHAFLSITLIVNYRCVRRGFMKLEIPIERQKKWRIYSIGLIVLFIAEILLWHFLLWDIQGHREMALQFNRLQFFGCSFLAASGVSAGRVLRNYYKDQLQTADEAGF